MTNGEERNEDCMRYQAMVTMKPYVPTILGIAETEEMGIDVIKP
jgi:hypothetical protein